MKDRCYNEGTIQAFLDGELAPEILERVAKHLSLCDGCSHLLEQAEEESAIAFAALDEGLNTLVPSERIRAKVYGAITSGEAVRENASLWDRIIASLSSGNGFGFGTPVATFAAMILAVGFVAVILSSRAGDPETGVNVAQINSPQPADQVTFREGVVFKPVVTETQADVEEQPADEFPAVNRISSSPSKPKREIQRDSGFRIEKADYREKQRQGGNLTITKKTPVLSEPTKEDTEEENFVRTIASLQQTVDAKKDEVLRPSQRIVYEKDMAVVDDAIKKMKKEMRKNPKNDGARQILMTSYQHKIDLLNSVTEKSELMASMQ